MSNQNTDQEMTPERWELLRIMTMKTTASMYPKATLDEVKTYVNELFKFEKFLMDKYTISFSEMTTLLLEHMKRATAEIAQSQALVEKVIEDMKNGKGYSKVNPDIQQVSNSLKYFALSHGYQDAEVLENASKIMDVYISDLL